MTRAAPNHARRDRGALPDSLRYRMRGGPGSTVSALLCPLVLALASAPAAARLLPPTPEEQAALASKQVREQAQLATEQEALARAQDRVAQRYGRGGSAVARTSEALLPKTATELPGDAGPHGRREPSAEAHSGNAR